MKPSGLNSIEFILSILVGLWKIAGWIVLIIVVGPVLYLLWSWNTMSYQAKTIQALNTAPVTRVVLDFNQCQIIATKTSRQIGHAVRVDVDGVDPQVTLPWLWHWLPWAPGRPPDRTENNPTSSLGNYEGVYLGNYRRPKDIPHADPWCYHGLLKLAPTKHWDVGTGPDYAFGKVAGNYRAYVGAVRAVMSIRYLLGGIAAGEQAYSLAIWANENGSPQLKGPVFPCALSNGGPPPEPPQPPRPLTPAYVQRFLTGYATDFDGKLPVVILELQKFDNAAWGSLRSECSDEVEWDKRMGWWGGTGAGQGGTPDNSRDFFITGLRPQGQMGGRPEFTPLDFLVNHLPSSTGSQWQFQAELTRMTEDAFWDPLLHNDAFTRDAAHSLLRQARKDMETDYRFARKYGYILFQGDKFGRDPSIMNDGAPTKRIGCGCRYSLRDGGAWSLRQGGWPWLRL